MVNVNQGQASSFGGRDPASAQLDYVVSKQNTILYQAPYEYTFISNMNLEHTLHFSMH